MDTMESLIFFPTGVRGVRLANMKGSPPHTEDARVSYCVWYYG